MDFVRVWHADTCTMGLGTSYVVMKHGKWETWRYRVAFISFKRYPKKEIFYLKFLKLTILILARIYMIPRWYTFNRSLPCDSIRFFERVGSGIVEELIFCNHQWKCFICPGFTCRWCGCSASVEEQINTNIQPRKILTGVAKNQNVEMTKFESRNTTTRNHQNKAPDR